ncbi:hypothetical protein INT47_003241 [Mucor saturninus]|uniref:RRM domain-containing protein n=1 Tax=Mucor saturninus TaxID=64648 RepID=A0A8H7RIG0_9FUNG|nr:hypothetical protein INT47_003241 [Mucor saturninus]
MSRLSVRGLSVYTTDDILYNTFSEHGEVEYTDLKKDRETGRTSGYGFVTMKTAEEAKAAMNALNGHELDGNVIQVNPASSDKHRGGVGHGFA